MAAPKILKIDEIPPDDFPAYFFDSNIWIAIIGQMGALPIRREEQAYLDFWANIVRVHERKGVPLLERKTKHFPKIILPAVTLTEVINALINIHGKSFFEANPSLIPSSEKPSIKKHYRPTEDYKAKLRQILSDFQALEKFLEFKNDGFDTLEIFDEFFNYNPDFDFNDYFYAKMFRGTNVPIVTNDGDFAMFEGITIITINPKLLRLK